MKRRSFIKSLPLTVAASGVFMQACETGNTTAPANVDTGILTTAAQFEADAIKTYETAAASGLITDTDVLDTTLLFSSHHVGHLDKLNEIIAELEGVPISRNAGQAVAELDGGAIRLDDLTSQSEVVDYAMRIEFLAAQFYFSEIQKNDGIVRKILANIFPVEFSHVTIYKTALGKTPAVDGSIFEEFTLGS